MIDKSPKGFIDPELIPWSPEAGIDGLFAKTLAKCEKTGSYTRLLKFLPGTDTSEAGVQSHDHLEELWIVEGAIYDLTLEENFVEGMYANRLHHMDHGPWRAPGGAITFELRDMDADGAIAKEQLEFFDPSLREWEMVDSDAGVYVKTLSACPDTGSFGRLVRFKPGATAPSGFRSDRARSELWVVSGVLANREDGSMQPSGMYANLDADLLDGSWTSPVGCTVFEVRNRI